MTEEANVLIRDATAEDAAEIFRIYLGSYMEKLGLESPEEMLEYDRQRYGPNYTFASLESLRKRLENLSEKERMLIAEVKGELAGFSYIKIFTIPRAPPEEDIILGYVEEFHIGKRYRGQGIGSKLLAASEEWLRGKGVKIIRLEASEDSVGFFLRRGYIPSHLERELYMDRLRYVVMIKLMDLDASVVERGIKALIEGDHRGSVSAFEELREKVEEYVEPLHLMMEYTGFLHSFAYHRSWDEKTWEIESIVRSLSEESRRYERFSGFLDGLARSIRAESLFFFSGNFGKAQQEFLETIKAFQRGLRELEMDPVFRNPPFNALKKFFECFMIWGEYYAALSTMLNELLSGSGKLIREEGLPDIETCEDVNALIKDIRALKDYMEDVRRSQEIIKRKMAIRLSGALVFYDYFSMERRIEHERMKEISKRLLSQLASLIGGSVSKAARPFLSEDIVAEVLKDRIYDIAELVLGTDLLTSILDRRVTLEGSTKVMLMPNGDFIIEYSFKFDDISLIELYYLLKAYEPSMREHVWLRIHEKNRTIPLRDFRRELIENVRSTIIDIEVRGLDEEVFYALALIDQVKAEGPWGREELYEEIATSLASPLTSLSLGPIDWLYPGEKPTVNLAPLISEPGFITVGERYAVLMLPTTEDWIVKEVRGLLLLMIYHKFLTSRINSYIDEIAMRFKEIPLSIKEVDEAIERLSSKSLRDLWIYWSPSLISHPEYRAFVRKAEKHMGLDKDIERLDERLLWLETLIGLEIKARSLISEEDRELLRMLGRDIAAYDIHTVSDPIVEVQLDREPMELKVGDVIRFTFRIYNPNPAALLVLKKIRGLLDRDYLELVEPGDAELEGEDLIINKVLKQYNEERVKVKMKAIREGELKLNISLEYKVKREERTKPICAYRLRISPP